MPLLPSSELPPSAETPVPKPASAPAAPSPPLPTGWTLRVFSDPTALAEAVAGRLLDQRLRHPERPLGLATGRTMEPIYAALARQVANLAQPERQRLRSQWRSFNLDEYVGLAPADPRCFKATMGQQLIEPLGLAPETVRLPRSDPEDPDQEARRYAAELKAAGGQDLQLLGLGLNGHVGFNEPPCGPEVGCRCVNLSPSTRRANAETFAGEAEAVPERAVTLGLRDILAASRILLVVTGAKKAGILRRLLLEPAGPWLPASWLRAHSDVTLIVDERALPGSPTG